MRKVDLRMNEMKKYDIPCKIKVDRRTVFEYEKKGIVSDEIDTFTQYSYAYKQLWIAIEKCIWKASFWR